MKIQNILTEEFGTQVSPLQTPKLTFRDLNTLQVRTLQRIADGQVDVDSANDNEYDIMADLAELGLLDQEYQLTKSGQNAVAIAKKLGGSSELLAARKKQQSMNDFDRNGGNQDMDPPGLDNMGISDDSVPDPDDEEGDEFDFNLGVMQSNRPSM